jgi:hypothetical protein
MPYEQEIMTAPFNLSARLSQNLSKNGRDDNDKTAVFLDFKASFLGLTSLAQFD